MTVRIIAAIFLVLGIAAFFGLTPEQIADDLMSLMSPKDSMREQVKTLRGGKRRHGLYRSLMRIKLALSATGKSKQFTLVCSASIVLFAVGILLTVFIRNVFLMPAVSAGLALLPFLYAKNLLSYYEKHTKAELETTLSIITTSYERCDDIVTAVRENIQYIKPPLREAFSAFVNEATMVSSSVKRAIRNLSEKVDDEIFHEWCDTLVQCQDDRTLKDTLNPVVDKLADVRIVNNELKTMLSAVRNEYLMMVLLVVGNVPLLYLLNKDWYRTLLYSLPGKAVCGLCGIVILVTACFMMKFTKPIEYRR